MIFNIKSIRTLPFLAMVLLLLTSACKKNFTGEIQDASVNRSFTPSALSISTVKDSAKFRWTASLYAERAVKYTLELSTDSMFSTVDYSVITDTTGAVVIDPAIKLNTPYFTRIKANAYNGKHASNYLYATRSFKLTGQQYFMVMRDFEITSSTVLLHWYVNSNTSGLTNITFTPQDGSNPINVSLSSGDVAAGFKLITGLTPNTKYTVQLFAGNKSKGIITASTNSVVNFTTTLSPTDNLATAIANANDGDVIGLNPGTYNLSSITYINQKNISIRSVSNNPADTKVLSREIDLVGNGAGITLAGIEFNGNYSGTSYGVAFMQLLGTQAAANMPATFTNIKIDNCVIHDYTRCILRGNYGANANDQKTGSISVNNSQIYNVDQTNVQGYYMFSLEKLQLDALSLTKSTFYNLGEGMINMSTNLSTTSGVVPNITIDYCTFNNFGGNSKYAFIDANANKIAFSFTNSIVANTPISQSIQSAAFRASASGNVLSFSNNDYFKLLTAPGGSALNLMGLAQANDLSIDLGWTPVTTNFLLTPNSGNTAVFSMSTNGSTVGDPRWAY